MYENLRALRHHKEITATEMKELLGLKTEAAYYKKEAGTIKISLEEAKKIAQRFQMNIEAIFFTYEVSEMETDAVLST